MLIRKETKGEVAEIHITRPRDRNSLSTPLLAALAETISEVEQTEARAMVIYGEGETHFVGGADGVEMMQLDTAGARAFSERIQGLFDRMEASPLILVAAIDGLCFGGGFELALACDLRVATERSRIGLPEVKVGLIPGGGGTQRLAMLVGRGRAMEMILSGKLLPAQKALDLGLVSAVVSPSGLDAAVSDLLTPILRQPSYALSLAKKAVRGAGAGSLAQGLEAERELFSRCFEHAYFPQLMRKQLSEGVLETSEDLSALLDATTGHEDER